MSIAENQAAENVVDKAEKTDDQKIREILEFALLMYNYYHQRDPWMTLSLDVLPRNLYGR